MEQKDDVWPRKSPILTLQNKHHHANYGCLVVGGAMHLSVPRNNAPMTVQVKKKNTLTVMILDFSQQLKCPRALHSADRHPPLSHRYRHEVPQELPRRPCVCALMGVHRSEFSRHVMDVPSHLGQSEDATGAKWSILGVFYCLWQLESIYAGFCF